ncbi:MAG: hypothetical protein WBX22_21335 [Silvibacterium sp.]
MRTIPSPTAGSDLRAVCSIRKDSHAAAVERLSAMMAEAERAPAGRFSPIDMIQGHGALAQLFTFVGDMDKAIEHAKAAYQIVVGSVPDTTPYLSETLGALYLHKSEMENGVYRDSGDQDFFPPLKPGALVAIPGIGPLTATATIAAIGTVRPSRIQH